MCFLLFFLNFLFVLFSFIYLFFTFCTFLYNNFSLIYYSLVPFNNFFHLLCISFVLEYFIYVMFISWTTFDVVCSVKDMLLCFIVIFCFVLFTCNTCQICMFIFHVHSYFSHLCFYFLKHFLFFKIQFWTWFQIILHFNFVILEFFALTFNL